MGIQFSNLNRVNSGSAETRKLRVYAFDPTVPRRRGNDLIVQVPYEPLTPGPWGAKLHVIDYDATNDRYYQPVDLDETKALLNAGVGASEADPRFHQQMVYAVASQTIRHFEFALGRDVKWGYRTHDPLTLYPHARYEANAYYSRDLKGIVFGYFRDTGGDAGQPVFTCLSHDIIAHEMTHALVDGQRSHFMVPTGFDTPAFHEAFADVVALFQHFSCKGAVLDAVQRTAGKLQILDTEPLQKRIAGEPDLVEDADVTNPMVELAKQFGYAMGQRSALRSALGTPPDPKDLDGNFEPHSRGSILVAAIFDAFFSLYLARTRDLMRIARASGASLEAGALHPDLANRLADDATRLAGQFMNLCIRALDYCPPVDITFGDFLRALITADHDLVPDDDLGYRETLLAAFRRRGIRPDGVRTHSEDDVLWEPFEPPAEGDPPQIDLSFDLMHPDPQAEEANAKALLAFAKANAGALKMVPGIKTAAHTFHPVHRIGPDGQLAIGVAAELIQDSGQALGGSTVLFNGDGTIRYLIHRSVSDQSMAQRRDDFQLHMSLNESGLVEPKSRDHRARIDFALVHRGV
jgi:hypothetical protein